MVRILKKMANDHREGGKGGSKTRQNVSLDVGKKRSHEATTMSTAQTNANAEKTQPSGATKKRRVLAPTASWEIAFEEQVESTFQSTSKTKTSRENVALVKPVTADRLEEKVLEGKQARQNETEMDVEDENDVPKSPKDSNAAIFDFPAISTMEDKEAFSKFRGECLKWSTTKNLKTAANGNKDADDSDDEGHTAEEDADVREAKRVSKLERTLNKDKFDEMQVIGQFNLGFIICQLNDDLFILDQHACDEKSTYERLLETTTLRVQPLIAPLGVELSASEEMVVIENLKVFEKNGFRFQINENARATERVKLVAVPFSKTTQFGVDDVHELASVILDRFGTNATSNSAIGGTKSQSGGSSLELAVQTEAI